jgi:hypothetical protein
MVSKKDRRESGRVESCSIKGLEEFTVRYYDDWKDYRDGFRDTRDKTKIVNSHEDKFKKRNKKLKRLNKIRKVRK